MTIGAFIWRGVLMATIWYCLWSNLTRDDPNVLAGLLYTLAVALNAFFLGAMVHKRWPD